MFPEPLRIFNLSIHSFGIFCALGFIAAYYVAYHERERCQISTDILPNLAFVLMMSSFIGARFLFVALNWSFFSQNWLDIFKFWQGGLVLYGGLIGGMLGTFIFCVREKLSFPKLSDTIALSLAIGFSLGRIGCFCAGCCYGKPADMPLSITFNHYLSLAHPLHVPLFPTQIYSFLIEFSIFLFLIFYRDKKSFDGELFLVYLAFSSIGRMVVQTLRAESNLIVLLIACFIFIFSILLYVQLKFKWGYFMKKLPWQSLSVILVLFMFTACGIITTQKVSRGHDISGVDQITKGVSTEKDVLKLIGPPTKVRDTNDGKELYYEYTKSGGPRWNLGISVGGNTVTKTLLVWLDKNGVVTDYAYKQS